MHAVAVVLTVLCEQDHGGGVRGLQRQDECEQGEVKCSRVELRIDGRDSTVATREGARVGDSEARIKSLYGSAVRVEPHKYTGPTGHYLTVTPANDTRHLIVFETDGERVTMFRVGRKPEVSYVEGCS